MSEPCDPVVCEIDVFLSRRLDNRLRLWQYPLRPARLPYDNFTRLETRVKPGQGRIELQLAVDTQSGHYARSKGEQIAMAVDHGERPPIYDGNCLDRQMLAAAGAHDTRRLVVGVYRGGELHLNAIHGCSQLRPAFNFLDHVDTQPVDEPQDEDAKPVMVRFARVESAETKARRLASYNFLKQSRDQEPWVTMRHHRISDEYTEAERSLLYAFGATEHSQFQLNGADYLQRLMPRRSASASDAHMSLGRLQDVPLKDQVRSLLVGAHVMRTAQLLALLCPAADPAIVLRSLQQVAVLVQGCWVVKSDVLYEGDSAAVAAHRRARDYILWKFTRSPMVRLRDITTVVRMPADDVSAMLMSLARRRANRGWQFAVEYDADFVARHPDVVTRQQMLWDAKLRQLSDALTLPKSDLKCVGSPRPRRASRSRSGGDRSDQSDTDVDHRKPVEIKVTNELEKELVAFARDRLHSRFVLSRADLRQQFEITLAQCEAGHILGSGVSDLQLEKAVCDAGAVRIPGRSPRDPTLFALIKGGDTFDSLRKVLLDMIADVGYVKFASLRMQLEKLLDNVPSEADVRRILKDYCFTKGGTWHLKGWQ